MAFEKVSPRDLKPGDSVEQLGQDFDFVYVPVDWVEKVRAAGSSTRYRVHLEGGDYIMVGSSKTVTVKRTATEKEA